MKWIKNLWFKFRYWRAPYIIGMDCGKGYDATVYAKYIDGVLYICKEEIAPKGDSDGL